MAGRRRVLTLTGLCLAASAAQHAQRLELRVTAAGAAQPLACWLELAVAEIEIEPAKVRVYLAEIQASEASRKAWMALQARAIPWRESYRKFGRKIEAR